MSRSGFLNTLVDDSRLNDWLSQLSAEDFQNYLVRLNGLIRQIKIKNRRIDGEGVAISNALMEIRYLPPRSEYKDELMRHLFESSKKLSKKDVGLLLYLSLQAIHPFADGNGRTGRLLYFLLESGETKTPLNKDRVARFLIHDDNSVSGREVFERKIKSPKEVDSMIGFLLAQDVLSKNITENISRLDSGLEGGRIEYFINEKITEETREKLTLVMSEAGNGHYVCRDITLARYLQKKGLIDTYATKDTDQESFYMDGQKILEELSESDAKEIIELFHILKKQFVEKLIDVIVQPNEYTDENGEMIKERMYK
ncbi:MAG: Fic family protein [Patescibacteria group bacterium]